MFQYTFRQDINTTDINNISNVDNNNINSNNSIVNPVNDHNSYNLNFTISEILLFSSVITATDTVAALTFVKENLEPKLFSIMLGEGVINDAVCIVLYKIIGEFSRSRESI